MCPNMSERRDPPDEPASPEQIGDKLRIWHALIHRSTCMRMRYEASFYMEWKY